MHVQNIECPKLCGFEGGRGQLEEHLSTECPLVQLECGYIYRGCQYSPVRRDYLDHMNGCLYQPKIVECGHEVNLKGEKEHFEECPEFPLPCTQCGYVFTRGRLLGHRCFPFLHGLIQTQGYQIEIQGYGIETQRLQIESLEQNMPVQRNKNQIQENNNQIQENNNQIQEKKIETQNHLVVEESDKNNLEK